MQRTQHSSIISHLGRPVFIVFEYDRVSSALSEWPRKCDPFGCCYGLTRRNCHRTFAVMLTKERKDLST